MKTQILCAVLLAISAPMVLMAADGGPAAPVAVSAESGEEADKPEAPAAPVADGGFVEVDKGEPAEPVAEEDKTMTTGDMLGGMIEAGKAGKWVALAGLCLMLLVSGVRRFSDKLKGKKWGYILAYGVPAVAALGYSMSQGQLSIDAMVAAVMAGMAGGQIRKAGKDAAGWVAGRAG